MIPKVIHYCWFGHNKKPSYVRKCIETWHQYCPDYTFKEWNEDNYDLSSSPFVKEAYDAKKWAFVTDYVRLDVIEKYGGIYLDTDVKLIKPLNALLSDSCFVAVDEGGINTGIGFGAMPHHWMIKRMLAQYQDKHFMVDGKMDMTPCNLITTPLFEHLGYDPHNPSTQHIRDVTIYAKDYFDPLDGATSEMCQSEHTIGIHLKSGSWTDRKTHLKSRIRIALGDAFIAKLKKLFS